MQDVLTEAKNMLVRRWGEMGGYWGISRTMAEIHALLFVSQKPLCTDDIMEQLHISRGNASMNLRALVDWGLIRRVHQLGDRKEYFQADTEVWHMFETIMRERRRREVEPIISTIDRCADLVADEADKGTEFNGENVDEFRRRIQSLREFLDTMGTLFEMVLKFGNDGLPELAAAFAESVEPDQSAATTPKKAAKDKATTSKTPANPTRPTKSRRKNTTARSTAS